MHRFISSYFSTLPTYLGSSIQTVTENGRLFTDVGGKLTEVVYANAADLAKLSYTGLQEGFYVVGSGNTGAALTLGAIGLGYTLAMTASAFALKRPHPSYKVLPRFSYLFYLQCRHGSTS